MNFPYTNECTDNCVLSLRPVPGALRYPRRSQCEQHGYAGERRSSLKTESSEADKPNHYLTEIASPADVREVGGNLVSQY